MVNPSKKAGLGNALNRAQKQVNDRRNPRKSERHTTEVDASQNNDKLKYLKSVVAQTDLDQFLEEADLAGKQFITEKRNVTLMKDDKTETNLYQQSERISLDAKVKMSQAEKESYLSVPRRPKWNSKTTPEQLAELEKLTFLSWRRRIATLQEQDDVTLTPFEKNLEVWRQLWRVIERSDIVVQILDCRNPLLYICTDLIRYVGDESCGKKINLLLLNKADYLTADQRIMWSKYFKSIGYKAMFFSALLENDCMQSKINHESESDDESVDHDKTSSDEERITDDSDEDDVTNRLRKNLDLNKDLDEEEENDAKIYDKFELLDKWKRMLDEIDHSHTKIHHYADCDNSSITNSETIDGPQINSHVPTVGLVGYPNVGKSSTINALLSAKRTAVSSTPGKTKHFQTFFIDNNMMLCDCPGLVFPNFISSKDEMVINGILPIDQMKDYIGPVRLIVQKIPRAFFQDIYGLAFEQDAKQNINAEDLLNSFGFMRGYMTARGLPDLSRAARKICKDYINGKILYCEAPPSEDVKLYHSKSRLAHAMNAIQEKAKDPSRGLKITERQSRLMRQAMGTDISAREFDTKFFGSKSTGVHIKGLPGIGNLTQPLGQNNESKVDKREKKHKKREKLRRVYRHLDV